MEEVKSAYVNKLQKVLDTEDVHYQDSHVLLANKLDGGANNPRNLKILKVYLTINGYLKIADDLKRKPTVPKNEYLKKLDKMISTDLFIINRVKGYLTQAPELVVRDVVSKLDKDIITKWYAKHKGIKSVKTDPKGAERIEKIEKAYWDFITDNREHILGTGRVSRLKDSLLIMSGDKTEAILLSLVTERKVYIQEHKGGETKKPLSFGGSYSTTTLKELKQVIKQFADNSDNKEYWNEVHKIVSKNL